MDDVYLTPRKIHAAAKAFARANLAQCSRDIVQWQDTGLLGDNAVLRELALICAGFAGGHDALAIAENIVKRAALDFVVAHGAEA